MTALPMQNKCLAFLKVGLIALSLSASWVTAQTQWPTKAVTLVVPFAPGGGTDIGSRIVAQKLSQLWGQSVLVDNRGGAGGNLGLEIVSRAKPDGYTLSQLPMGIFRIPHIQKTLFNEARLHALVDDA